jgi:hypothetical protein
LFNDIDEKDQKKVLDYLNDRSLKEHPLASYTAEKIAKETGLDVSKVKEIGNDAIGRNWVDVDHYNDAGEWMIRINSRGKTARDELKSAKNNPNISDSKIIAGRDVNIIDAGNNNKIESKNLPLKDEKYSKRNLIIAIVIAIGTLILVGYVVYDHMKPTETKMQQPQTPEQKQPIVSLDVLTRDEGNGTTLSLIVLKNNGSAMASNVLMTINPSTEIVNYSPVYRIDEAKIQKNGPKSLTTNMIRLSTCSKFFLSMHTYGMITDQETYVRVTYDNMEKPLWYDARINGTKLINLDPNGIFKISTSCK